MSSPLKSKKGEGEGRELERISFPSVGRLIKGIFVLQGNGGGFRSRGGGKKAPGEYLKAVV